MNFTETLLRKKLLLTIVLGLGISFIFVNSASATVQPNPFPGDASTWNPPSSYGSNFTIPSYYMAGNAIPDCDNLANAAAGIYNYFGTWIAPAGNPASVSIPIVNYNTPFVSLEYNQLMVNCHASSATGGIYITESQNHITRVDYRSDSADRITGFGIAPNVTSGVAVSNGAFKGAFGTSAQSFDFYHNGGFTADGWHEIRFRFTTTIRRSNGTYACVNTTGNPINIANHSDTGNGFVWDEDFTFFVPVRPPPGACTISNIVRDSDGGLPLIPGQPIRFDINVNNAAGYYLGVNGTNPWGDEYPGTNITNYLAPDNVYIRGPLITSNSYSATVRGVSNVDFGAPTTPMNAPGVDSPFNWGIVLPGTGWLPITCSAQIIFNPTVEDRAPNITFTPNCDAAANKHYVTITVTDPDTATNPVAASVTFSSGVPLSPGSPQNANPPGYQVIVNATARDTFSVTASTNGVYPTNPTNLKSVTRTSPTFGPCRFRFLMETVVDEPDLNDPELPTEVDFGSRARVTFPSTGSLVLGVTPSYSYFVNRGGTYDGTAFTMTGGSVISPPAIGNPPVNAATCPSGASTYTTSFKICDYDNVSLGAYVAQMGDWICNRFGTSPSEGEIDGAGNIVATTAPLLRSKTRCFRVSNRPYVSFYGNDVQVGAGFDNIAGTCDTGDATAGIDTYNGGSLRGYRGSGSQIAAIALENISGFRSASVSTPANPILLSFSNTVNNVPASQQYGGKFSLVDCSRNYWNIEGSSVLRPDQSINLSTFTTSGSYHYEASVDDTSVNNRLGLKVPIRITGRLNAGIKVALYIDGDVMLVGNGASPDRVGYNAGPATVWATRDDIPSLFVIAYGNIFVSNAITRLDGNYIAQNSFNGSESGQIYTCTKNGGRILYNYGTDAADRALFAAECDQKLTVYGTFTAEKVILLRIASSLRNFNVAGENVITSNAAEVFQYPSETFVAIPATVEPDPLRYDSIVSLPPTL